MSRDEVIHALESGQSPGTVAQGLGRPLEDILLTIDQAIGTGRLQRFAVYFTISSNTRDRVEDVLETNLGHLSRQDVQAISVRDRVPFLDVADIEVCLRYGPVSRHFGELYELLRCFELRVHGFLKVVLEQAYGPGRGGWWLQGVPVMVRVKCVSRVEELAHEHFEPWRMTDLLDLWETINKQWPIFGQLFRGPTTPSKRDLEFDFKRLNEVRNRVMHPVREMPPSEGDFELVNRILSRLAAAEAVFNSS